MLRKCGLLAHTSPTFLKNCWIKKFFNCLRLDFCNQSKSQKRRQPTLFSESAIFCCGCLCFTRSTGNGHFGRYPQRRRIFPVYRPKSLWQKKLSIQSYLIQQNHCLQLRTNQCLHFNFNQLCWTIQFLNPNPSAARTAFLEKFRISFCDFHIIRRTGCPDIHLHHFFLRNAVFFQQLHQFCKDILCLCIRVALAINRSFRCNRSCSGNKYKRVYFYNSRITGNLFKTEPPLIFTL